MNLPKRTTCVLESKEIFEAIPEGNSKNFSVKALGEIAQENIGKQLKRAF